ncbi:MAG: DUF433 domain-containing protein [Phycisphaerales bacterium]
MSEPVTPSKLSAPTVAVLEMIAAGHSYEQIIQAYPALTYRDIFAAAEEALALGEGGNAARIARIREQHPRAYEKWTPEEEQQLRGLIAAGHAVPAIAHRLQRQTGAIHSRLVRLGLNEKMPTIPAEGMTNLPDQAAGGHHG